jgi:hypothetical protein
MPFDAALTEAELSRLPLQQTADSCDCSIVASFCNRVTPGMTGLLFGEAAKKWSL